VKNESFCVDGGAVSVTIRLVIRKAFQYCTDLRQHAGRDHYLRYLIYSVPKNIKHGSLRWCALDRRQQDDATTSRILMSAGRHPVILFNPYVVSFALLVAARRQQSDTYIYHIIYSVASFALLVRTCMS
jgi:hypothetical protein